MSDNNDNTAQPAAGSKPFTDREKEVLIDAWNCLKTMPEIDYDKLATRQGYSVASARTIWGGLKRRVLAAGDGTLPSTPSTPKTPKTPRKRKTPVKPKSGTKAKNESEDDDGHPLKKAKTEDGAADVKLKKEPLREEPEEEDELI